VTIVEQIATVTLTVLNVLGFLHLYLRVTKLEKANRELEAAAREIIEALYQWSEKK
jgi:hypothetical protein